MQNNVGKQIHLNEDRKISENEAYKMCENI